MSRTRQFRVQVNFNTAAFREAQGKLPRGRAIWIFYFSDAPDEPWIARRPDNQLRPLSYMAAKNYATAEARRRRVTAVKVDAHPL